MKKLILSFVMLMSLFTLASCVVSSETQISFHTLPKAVYYEAEVENMIEEVKVNVPELENPCTLSQAESFGAIVTGISKEVGQHTLVVTYKSFSITFKYEVVAKAVGVKTAKALKDELENGTPVIEIMDSFTVEETLNIRKPATIYGNGHLISGNKKIFDVQNLENCSLLLYDLNIKTTGAEAFYLKNCENVELIIDNCNFSSAKYCIKLSISENLDVTIKNGSVSSGWAALNCLSTNSTVTILDTKLIGTNPYSEGANSYATITIDGAAYQGNSGLGCNTTYIFENVTVESEELGACKQWHIEFQGLASNNKVYFNDCNFKFNKNESEIIIKYDDPKDSYGWEAGPNNQVYINGEKQ